MKIIFIFSCSGMFRNVPACSGMFRVPGFIDGLCRGRFLNNNIILETKPPIKSRNTIDSMVCLLENKVDRLYICGGGDKTKKTSCLNIFTASLSQIDHVPQFVLSHTRFLWSSV